VHFIRMILLRLSGTLVSLFSGMCCLRGRLITKFPIDLYSRAWLAATGEFLNSARNHLLLSAFRVPGGGEILWLATNVEEYRQHDQECLQLARAVWVPCPRRGTRWHGSIAWPQLLNTATTKC
jgi:hypothetical protein